MFGIIFLTYASSAGSPRAYYANRTMDSLVKNLKINDAIVYIADDGSYEGHIKGLVRKVKERGWEPRSTNAQRGGYGRSYNLATQLAHQECDTFLMMEDDWELTREFDPTDLSKAIKDSNDNLGCIRLGYIGWTNPLVGVIKAYSDQTFLEFDPDSPEVHVWTGHPRIESKSFQRKVGEWPEGIDAGSTEFAISKRDASRSGVAWPLDIAIRAGQIHGTLFAHIGEIQAREDQIAI